MAIIGIDLGTSNAVAAFRLQKDQAQCQGLPGEADRQRYATNDVRLRALPGKTRRQFQE